MLVVLSLQCLALTIKTLRGIERSNMFQKNYFMLFDNRSIWTQFNLESQLEWMMVGYLLLQALADLE